MSQAEDSSTMTQFSDDQDLSQFRAEIDAIDAHILDLMNRRLELAQSVAAVKNAGSDTPVYYRPEREQQILKRLQHINQGRMSDQAIESLFREVMSITRSSEAALSVAVLGPQGTYSESAAQKHFGRAIDILTCQSIAQVFAAVERDEANYAVVPVENSIEGGVSATYRCLYNTPLKICGEINFPIQHQLLSKAEAVSDIDVVYAHSQSLGQCTRWLNAHLPGVRQVAVSSNAEAAKKATEELHAAAIAGDSAALQYQLNTLHQRIEDEHDNTTRFLILSKSDIPPSGQDKTCVLLSCKNRPGGLFDLLSPLQKYQVDMAKIESRPSDVGLWDYVFFIDIEGHQQDSAVANALVEIEQEAGLFKNLGSFPAALS